MPFHVALMLTGRFAVAPRKIEIAPTEQAATVSGDRGADRGAQTDPISLDTFGKTCALDLGEFGAGDDLPNRRSCALSVAASAPTEDDHR